MIAAVSEWTEAEFQRHVVALAVERGWGFSAAASKKLDEDLAAYGQPPVPLNGLIFHPRIMYRSEPGWPDLTLIRKRDRRVIFAELKTDKPSSKVTPRQAAVLDLLAEVFGCGWRDEPSASVRPYEIRFGCSVHAELTIGVYVWRPRDLAQITEVLA